MTQPRRILVIGGGPSGLVTLRNLIQIGQFNHVELVERRDDVGGVWYLDNPPPENSKPRWPSPAYPNLVGNVLPEFLSFAHYPFPETSDPKQPYPTLSETHAYLKGFAAPYLASGNIKLNTEVTAVEELDSGRGWRVRLNDWNTGGEAREEVWDAVVVAVSWYDNLVWPDTKGIDLLREKGLAKHGKWWRGPKGYEGKRALVIGNGNSSNDIAAHLAPVAKSPVYRSIRRAAFPGFVSLPDDRIHDVVPVSEYTFVNDKVTATLTDGTIITDIDEVQVGTGYKPFPDFLHVLKDKSTLVPFMDPSITPHRIPSLHRLIVYAHNPTLAFIGTAAISHTPFTIADVTSTWLALVWRGVITIPETVGERLAFEAERLAFIEKCRSQTDNPSSLEVYGVLSVSEEGYAAGLKEDIVKVKPELKDVLPEWNEERTKHRERMFAIKRNALEYVKGLKRDSIK